jgi:DNA replication protein DnaC
MSSAELLLLGNKCGTADRHSSTDHARSRGYPTAVGSRSFTKINRAKRRWARYEVIGIDEVGYVPMADVGAEFLFQVIAERTEKAAVILTTNLPFSEWTQVIPNARLCKALLDRITDRAHILETGTESYRFRRSVDKQKKKAS